MLAVVFVSAACAMCGALIVAREGMGQVEYLVSIALTMTLLVLAFRATREAIRRA